MKKLIYSSDLYNSTKIYYYELQLEVKNARVRELSINIANETFWMKL